MKFDILTIFPQMFSAQGRSASGGDVGYLNQSIIKRAQEKKLITIRAHDIRAFSKDKHRKVDDRPFGGGAGMVMMAQPIADGVQRIKNQELRKKNKKIRVILFSTRGKKFTNKDARRLSKYNQLILICGRYEGVDQRVAEHVADEEISIGDYVLTGGELPAMVVIDAVSRQVKGVLGKNTSLEEVQGSYPTYTRPEKIKLQITSYQAKKKQRKPKIIGVPKVLLSGDHMAIDEWRRR